MAACKSCAEKIIYAQTANRKSMPLDELPNLTKGNVRLETIDDGLRIATTLGKVEAQAARDAGEQLYLSHFATCPRGPAHRRR
ncbi:hypothetical protein SEA_ZITCH_51 [Gordonia Phage Zitch]|uniref:Uncharacterized protein n=3 Tax=Zitchvirus TaxID=2948963 RepID=A0A976U9Q6_9CAUD|nr:hypothetical protein J1774_gp51 [Gordonia Phage Zitch]QKY78497.1 hypothetical protein SEA_ZITCH_51 [Gordonia Phage Zitch]UVF61670.1 hypothetical protein SEA_APUNK_49 [Gordonia phage APunk]UVG35011.1 hypothetical protein SEA_VIACONLECTUS_48 [Gordonia phage ViaConlectus]